MPKYKLTGASAGVGGFSLGAQWQVDLSDRDVAVQLIDELEDRRLLWPAHHREDPLRCAASASYIRQFIGTLLRTPGLGRELKTELKTIRRHFTEFMSNLSTYDLDRPPPVDLQALERVLRWLREPVGEQVGLLAAQYQIDVSAELAQIVPDRCEWFFREFNS
ncbi:hypothetical protein [Ornithinimicrobium pratense]|uniref:Uncharacterized protein n=1 Tax=Ornithinimicrobium pratense TaxID=2593973 RepID=A0A5J6V319_9MICO|nr:hypothetical protein [Ornithinimicrobium pratense]QFG67686.1 hypothetical protein FY030_02140 [Ornithinimicrobium pratense]